MDRFIYQYTKNKKIMIYSDKSSVFCCDYKKIKNPKVT